MTGNLLPVHVFITAGPITIIGLIYFLLVRFRCRGLSRPVHAAFIVTLANLVIWGTYQLVVVATGDGWSQLMFIYREVYFLPLQKSGHSLMVL